MTSATLLKMATTIPHHLSENDVAPKPDQRMARTLTSHALRKQRQMRSSALDVDL